jgi:hypothetical protein
MVNWIAGVWPEPWRCLVSHAGIYDTRSMGAATEELWFTEWEFGGTPWDNPEGYERFNPRNYVGNWRTPMLVIQGERDFRVIGEQSLAAFNTLQRRGIESRLLWFPDENHWILKPQNSVHWHNEVERWLNLHTGPGAGPARRVAAGSAVNARPGAVFAPPVVGESVGPVRAPAPAIGTLTYRCDDGRSFEAVHNAAGARVTAGRITATLPGDGPGRWSDGSSTLIVSNAGAYLTGMPGSPYARCLPG